MTDVTHTSLEQLLAAYRSTQYRVWAPGRQLVLRVDQYDAELAKLLREAWVDGAALITAWNPGSVRQPAPVNQSRQQELERELRTLECACLQARNEPLVDDGPAVDTGTSSWTEDSILALGLSLPVARELALRHGQVAFLWIDKAATPRLIVSEAN